MQPLATSLHYPFKRSNQLQNKTFYTPKTELILTTEQELIKGCLKGDKKAQRAFYDRYKQDVYGICLRYARDRAEALDMAQEGFIRIFADLYQYRPIGPFGGWLRRVVVNAALQHIRRRKKMFFSSDDLTVYDAQNATDADALGNLNAQDLIRLVQKLPDGYRMVFNLYAIEGFSHKEIAEQLGISESTSKSQLSRAKAMLRTMLENILI